MSRFHFLDKFFQLQTILLNFYFGLSELLVVALDITLMNNLFRPEVRVLLNSLLVKLATGFP